MKPLSRDDILAAEDLPRELVEVPEWGGFVYVRGLTGAERDRYESELVTVVGSGRNQQTRLNMADARARLCARTICDENGERLFSDRDIQVLGQKSATALNRVFEAAMRLSGLSERDVEDLVKNSESTPSDGSGSG